MPYDDKTMMTDMLSTQKFIASNYNNYAGEISTKTAKNKLLKILQEEHDIQFKIFEDMQAKGWYETTNAPQAKVDQAVQTHITSATNLKKPVEKAVKKRAKATKKTK
ncbi:MAG: spore coat protein [Oscillospiraceae bacterium]|nr:spore coat protein [Oscillospiraceae bacterium]